jgi:hypothetical protein
MLRGVTVSIVLLAGLPALAGEMKVEEARHFVIGKVFSYTCFEGTRGLGRVQPDGSVSGSIQFQGKGQVYYAHLPAGTLRVKGEAVCASVRGMPIEPCFNLDRVDNNSFRGSIEGLGFAYCDFTRQHGRAAVAHSTDHTHTNQPLGLRPSLTAEAN